jgi:hypothetical protein
MKKLLSLLLLVTMQIHAMNLSPKVRVVNSSIASAPMPKLKIGDCSYCDKKAELLCTACEATYYCSKKCQKLHWGTHKAMCSELKKAQSGDIAHMRNIFYAYVEGARKHKNKAFIEVGVHWHLRTLIRLTQDIVCSNDKSTRLSAERIHVEHGQLMLTELINPQICTQKELEDLSIGKEKDALEWVASRTAAKKLVPPFGIRDYGIMAPLNSQMNKDKEFIPEKKWHDMRMKMIQFQREEIEKKNK